MGVAEQAQANGKTQLVRIVFRCEETVNRREKFKG